MTIFFFSKYPRRNGSSALIASLFPGFETPPDASYDVCLQFDCDQFTNDQAFLDKICQIKRHLLGGPFHAALSALQTGSTPPVAASSYAYRVNEYLYITPSDSKVVVTFLVDPQDTMDKAMTRIYLQEFVEGQRSVRTAPPVQYSKEPPLELQNLRLNTKSNIAGFISFALEKRHVEGNKLETAVTSLTQFRSYLLYHIKCAKTYLQMRMRKRVAGWLQVLNRAVPETETMEKKTAAGKTFVRK
jgi:actin related protein 2/3 complex subunit 2